MSDYEEDIYELEHSGVMHRSGRFKEGIGDRPHQCVPSFGTGSFNGDVNALMKQINPETGKHWTKAEIAKDWGYKSRAELDARISLEKENQVKADRARAAQLKYDKQWSNTAIARYLGVSEGTVRNYLKPVEEQRKAGVRETADVLAKRVKDAKYIDVGSGSQLYLGVTEQRMKNAIALLQAEGYEIHRFKTPQLGTQNNLTEIKVLCAPGTPWKEVFSHREDISLPIDYKIESDKVTKLGLQWQPVAIKRDRVGIRFKEDGGEDRDGTIELRRGVEDISLQGDRYKQVRINVENQYYLKGMAVYSDDMPDGVDIMFNSNKTKGTADAKVFKPLKTKKEKVDGEEVDTGVIDWDNPFGATVRQFEYTTKTGKKAKSAINVVNDETDWDKWSKNTASQFLSKQSVDLAKTQLTKAYDAKKAEFDTIMSLTNPAVKKKLLAEFADSCDSDAVDLKGAAFPRQKTHVILPITTLKDNEIYAPNYNNGEKVCLIRYPHAGTFEIAELTVNNKNARGKEVIGNSSTAVGITKKTADQLSGADFDGDSVVVIPMVGKAANIKTGRTETSAELKALRTFDPKTRYKKTDDQPKTGKEDNFAKQKQMGSVSNLITDMTLQGAPASEVARAVKHSMVVIDAEKHNLDWKQSEIDNDIPGLKAKWQGGSNRGASTIVSKASSESRINGIRKKGIDPVTGKRTGIDSRTGEKVWEIVSDPYVDKNGKLVERTTKSTKMYDVEDAYSLISKHNPTAMEYVYADYANSMKSLGNQARKAWVETPNQKYNPSAAKVYSEERASLKGKLTQALSNAPLERKAQVLANLTVAEKRASNPGLDKDDVKKIKGQALNAARVRVGAHKNQIDISPKEWEAIQAGAVTQNMLEQILSNSNPDKVKQYAMPRNDRALSNAEQIRIRTMLANGRTQAEIAEALNISTSTVSKVRLEEV